MEEKPEQTIEHLVYRLIRTEISKNKYIGLFQIVSDEQMPVFLSSQDVDYDNKISYRAPKFSPFELGIEILRQYQKEKQKTLQMEDFLKQVKLHFDELRKAVIATIDNAEQKLIEKVFFPDDLTLQLVHGFADGTLNDDKKFLEQVEKLLRSYGVSNKEEVVQKGLESVSSLVDEMHETLGKSLKQKIIEVQSVIKPWRSPYSTEDFNTKIIDPSEGLSFFRKSLENITKDPEFYLLFRGSSNGFSASEFHKSCDNRGPTIVLVETIEGKIFGGFASVPWEASWKTCKADEKAFLFSWDHKEIYRQTQNFESALCFDHTCGPIFGMKAGGNGPERGGGLGLGAVMRLGRRERGGGFVDDEYDLAISDHCNINKSSSMNMNGTYSSNGRERDAISGGKRFQVKDFEVFLVK